MLNVLIDLGSLLAFLIFCWGAIFQIRRTLQRRSSADTALEEIYFRLLASVLIFAKMIKTGDPYLITGSSLFLATLTINTIIIWLFHDNSHRPT